MALHPRPGGRRPRLRPAGPAGRASSTPAEYLDAYWGRADVKVEGDPSSSRPCASPSSHTLQSAARAEKRPIRPRASPAPATTATRSGTAETFVLPVLTYTAPETVLGDALVMAPLDARPLATERARQLRLDGATFPWRTIRGHECSAYWPAGTAAFHVNADIADAVLRYLHATDDDEFARVCPGAVAAGSDRASVAPAGPPRRLGGAFHIDGVTGPDEYSAIADDNVYTNLMAAQNLGAGAAESSAISNSHTTTSARPR